MDRFDPARLDARAAIARYADGKLLSKLAPLVEWVADRIDRPAPQRDAIPRGPSRGEVRLEPVTRKMLAFDDSPKVWLVATALTVLFIVWPAANGVYTVLTKDRAQTGVPVSISCAFACVGLIISVYGMALRLRTLRRLLATCLVVPSRLTSCSECWEEGDLSVHFTMTFEYWYAGMRHKHSYERANLKERDLIGETPELLVPTSSPERALIRDFYT